MPLHLDCPTPAPIKYILEGCVPFLGFSPSDFLQRFLQSTDYAFDYANTLWIVRQYALRLDIESRCEVLYRLTIKFEVIVTMDILRWDEQYDYFFLDAFYYANRVEQISWYCPCNRPLQHLFDCYYQILLIIFRSR